MTNNELRLNIQRIDTVLVSLTPTQNREIALAITKLQEAKHWLTDALNNPSVE